jgi:hypothetical protein
MEEYEGSHTDDVPGRVATRLLPFMARALHAELPKVQFADLDLGTVVAGQPVPGVSVVLAAPLEATGTFPQLSLDLSPLGAPDAMPMQHDGNGRYSARASLAPLQNGLYYLTVSLEEGMGARFPLTLVNLAVWPASDLRIVSDGLADGWSTQVQRVTALDPQATAQTYEGSSA